MKKIQWKGGALLAPVPPAMVTCGSMEQPNVLTIAWTGIINTIPPKTYISVRPSRFSYPMIKESGEFVINLTTASMIRAADFCGVRSGRELDKFEACGLEIEEGFTVSAPVLSQSPVSLECRVTEIIPLGSHDMFLAEVVAVHVSEDYMEGNGRFCLNQTGLVAYSHGEYFSLGKKLGTFGYSVRKPAKKKGKHRR